MIFNGERGAPIGNVDAKNMNYQATLNDKVPIIFFQKVVRNNQPLALFIRIYDYRTDLSSRVSLIPRYVNTLIAQEENERVNNCFLGRNCW